MEKQRKFMDEVGKELGCAGDLAGWYKVSTQTLCDHGGLVLLRRYGDSISTLLTSVYPEFKWDPLKFTRVPHNYWDSKANQRAFLDELGMKLGINSGDTEGWYKIYNKIVIQNGGNAILKRYNDSLPEMLAAVYPELKWDTSRFLQRKEWNSFEIQKRFLDELGARLGIKDGHREGWYKVSTQVVIDLGGASLLSLFNGSLIALLSTIYPDFNWNPLKFVKVPQKYWASVENQRAFMDDVGRQLGFREGELDRWYAVSTQIFIDHGGKSILQRYNDSLSTILTNIYPEHNWDPLRFTKVPQNYWASKANQRAFLDALARKLDFKEGEFGGWYNVSHRILRDNGGRGLLEHYNGSIAELITSIYPEHDWHIWRFPRGSSRVFLDPFVLLQVVESVERALQIKSPQEWYRVSQEQLDALDVSRVFQASAGGLVAALSQKYPEEKWDTTKFARREDRR